MLSGSASSFVKFQFHIGAIISCKPVGIFFRVVTFQFHIGAIISRTGITTSAQRCTVSIPHWCNYKEENEDLEDELNAAFQFHIGAIISC